MTETMFNRYLLYQKEKNATIWRKLLKLPWRIWIVLLLTVAAILISIIMLFLPCAQPFLWISSIVEIILIVLFYLVTERFQITSSKETLERLQNYYKELAGWLGENGYGTNEAIRILYNRVAEYVGKEEGKRKEREATVEKWLQTLAVPVILSVISTVISGQSNLEIMINVVMIIMAVFITCCSIGWVIKGILEFPQKRRLEQMKWFMEDLQDILDIEENGIMIKHNKACGEGNI